MKITTDLTGTESAATRHTRIKAIYDWYFGTGAYVAAGNLGVARAALNGLLTSDIANGETFASWLVKMNWLNDLDTAIPALIFAGGYKGIVIDPEVLSSMSQDTAGATPVTAAGQSVGRILDRSGNALHPVQATAAARPTYQLDGSSRPYLSFDGVDDVMSSAPFAWGSDEVTFVAALRKRSDSARGEVVNFGGIGDNGSWQLGTPGTGSERAWMVSKGTVQSGYASSSAAYNAPISMVMTGSAKIGTDALSLRINGALAGSAATDMGTGNFGTRSLQIGASIYGGWRTAMDLYGLLSVNKSLTTQERGWVEKWTALKSGVTLA